LTHQHPDEVFEDGKPLIAIHATSSFFFALFVS
jgi:hypothetical protein